MCESENHDWLYCGIIDQQGLIFSRDPYAFGAFEFTRSSDLMPGCDEALAESARVFSFTLGDNPLRMKCFFLNTPEKDALRSGRIYAKETLALMSIIGLHPMPPTLSRVGYMFNLTTSEAKPILPSTIERTENMMGTMAVLDENAAHPLLTLNSLLSTAPDNYGELGRDLRRSTHWSTLARQADDESERLLMLWISAETLSKVSENDGPVPKFVAALGFPGQRYLATLSDHERNELLRVPYYRSWRGRLNRVYDDFRGLRNDIAHSGHRELELSGGLSEADFRTIKRSFPFVISTIQTMACNALALGIRTIDEMWSRYGECICYLRPITLAQHVQGNVIFHLTMTNDPFDD